ncbi:MAG: DUF3892 domain-containing protein [Planctomycetaceae bacterium]|jgi:hypothetical protein|nr:DUF3892 domain-containing protein [Planctomycetaceae bacterium]
MTTIISAVEQLQIDVLGLCTRRIIAVRKDGNTILSVKVRDNGIITKKDVIQDIQSGIIEYITAKNTPVRVVADKYIRSDANDTEADNLGSLPSF